jgi:hypothetical protein
VSQVNQYDPNNNIVTFCSVLIQGFADGTYIEVERDEDGWSKQKGSQGDTTWVRNRNRGGKITVTLMAGSPTNDALNLIAQQDELLGTGVGPASVREIGGTTFVRATFARIQKRPAITRSKDGSHTVQWIFDCADLEPSVGGLVTML